MKRLFIVLIFICATISAYVAFSILNPVSGTIIFGGESVVFTPRNFDQIDSLDYHKSNKGWYWVWNNDKLNRVLENSDKDYLLSQNGYLQVEIRYVDLFFSSRASYVAKANIPMIYIWSVKQRR